MQLLMPGLMQSFMSSIDMSGDFDYAQRGNRIYHNVFVYTINTTNEQIVRNSGFCFEPVLFSIFLNVGLLFNLSKNVKKIGGNSKFWILLIALLTTSSTTGIIIFMINFIVLLYFRKKGYTKHIAIAFAIAAFFLISYNSPILYTKVKDSIGNEGDITLLLEQSKYTKSPESAGRFISLYIVNESLKHNSAYILGIGGNSSIRLFTELHLVSGIGNMLLIFGLVGLSFLLISMFKSARLFAIFYNDQLLKAGLLLILLLGNIGYILFSLPLFFSLMFFHFYTVKQISFKKHYGKRNSRKLIR
jgi:hypothetical protein